MEIVSENVEELQSGDEEHDPCDLVHALDANSRLREALSRLSPVQRQVIGLAFYKGMTQQEIANHLPMPLGTVKSSMRRAVNALRVAIGPGYV